MHLMFNVCCVKPFNLIRTVLISSAVVSTLVVTGCASKPQVSSQTRSLTAPSYYTVRSGDTLSTIAEKYGLNYLQIAQMNDIAPPYRIYVGQSLRLSNKNQSKTTKTQPIQQATQITRQKVNLPTASVTPATTVGTVNHNATTVAGSRDLKWVKPSNGPIIARFDLANNIKGIRFGGKIGDPVVAAADGQVIYAADGLKEYGNLVLIKHSNGYITAYAHNHKLWVKSGQNVTAGQKIAEMGSSGTTQPMLEFQVRLDGKPINPEKIY